jgi:hypothetical protein
MKSLLTPIRRIAVLSATACLLGLTVPAYPPAPHHLIYGMVRDEMGNPLDVENAELVLETSAGIRILGEVIPGMAPGVNYQLAVPMDSGLTEEAYKPTALRPTVPFKIHVRIGRLVYVPMEMRGDYSRMGQPGQRTRLDLTLGEDLDGDGLPDAWERALIALLGGNLTIWDIRPEDDLDGDGLTNWQEYLAGTYAFDPKDGFALKMVRREGGKAVLEFMAIRGRTYSIQSSPDLKEWDLIPFQPPGAPFPIESHFARDLRVLQVEVPLEEENSPRFFKLMVQ